MVPSQQSMDSHPERTVSLGDRVAMARRVLRLSPHQREGKSAGDKRLVAYCYPSAKSVILP